MAILVSYLVRMIIGYHHKTGDWPQEDIRTEFTNRWLEKTGHRASFWKLSKLALVADGIARTTMANVPSLMEMITSDHVARDEFAADLLAMCRSVLLQQGITA
ncbi:hypothetical protein [Neoroseomonas soli]|uniref:Uncharacterized protein n=1 Tax=Neoroseomonas soli TaxID=1081025 RepID=A0A9X9WSJ4_9PROT|nr:hypothetical protein [Neoroseomonas soli]MBR0670123.1 hypothetical protein [Neoroseomonas soli]